MRRVSVVPVLLLCLLALVSPIRSAQADWWAGMYQVQCIPELDVLELRRFDVNSKIAVHAVIEQRNERLEKQHGFYVPSWHYRFDDDAARYDSRGVIINPGGFVRSPVSFVCMLSSGLVELIILPEPLGQIWHSGGDTWDVDETAESISISLRVAGRMILDDIPFRRCEDDATISKFLYAGGYFTLTGVFGQQRPIDQATPARLRRPATKYFFVKPTFVSVTVEGESSPPEHHEYATPLGAQEVLGPVLTHGNENIEEGYYSCEYLGPNGATPHRQPAGPSETTKPRFPS